VCCVAADASATVEGSGRRFISEYVYYFGHAIHTVREYVVKDYGSLDGGEWSASRLLAALSSDNLSLVPIEWCPDLIRVPETEGKHPHISRNLTTIFRSSDPLSSHCVDFAIPELLCFPKCVFSHE
jgi:hypothetical protein